MNDTIELAKRAKACEGWRWLPGMLSQYLGEGAKARLGGVSEAGFDASLVPDGMLPDLDDPATKGCLLALVREAWDDPYAQVVADPYAYWRLQGSRHYEGVYDATGRGEIETLVAALEAASCPSRRHASRRPRNT